MVNRREFLASCVGLLSASIARPAKLFIPPREPYVYLAPSLMGLYKHLGVLPVSEELSICEGMLREVQDWDGVGYPCVVENACCSSPGRCAVVYDFDLYNFRHDDALRERMGRDAYNAQIRLYNNHAGWYAHRRFGADAFGLIREGGGWLTKWVDYWPKSRWQRFLGVRHHELTEGIGR